MLDTDAIAHRAAETSTIKGLEHGNGSQKPNAASARHAWPGYALLAHPISFRTHLVDAGYFCKSSFGRIGRLTKLPPQFGHLPLKTEFAQEEQNVHSKVQMNASLDSGGKFLLQHSQFGLSSNMMTSALVVHNTAIFGNCKLSATWPC